MADLYYSHRLFSLWHPARKRSRLPRWAYAIGRNVTPLPDGLDRLDWDSKLKDILPGLWELMDGSANEMASLKDILSHQSGVPRHVVLLILMLCLPDSFGRHDLSHSRNDTAKDMVSRLRYLRPAFEIRERWNYTNLVCGIELH